MKEDYLWNKKGNDAEIEKLENALAQFRYRETAAPVIIPEKISTVAEKPKRRIFNFSLAFSFASCAAFVLILLGAWFQFSGKNAANISDLSKSIPPEVKIVLPNEPDKIISPEELKRSSEKSETPKHIKAKNPISEKKIAPQKTVLIKRKGEKPKAETLELTEEEKYAYDQLMLALSITSSKLNLVKEKVAFIESPNLSVKQESQ